MIEITGVMALHYIRRAVRAKGDSFVYTNPTGAKAGALDASGRTPTCFYLHEKEDGTTEPGCIVGHVVHALGVSEEIISDQENTTSCALIAHVGEKDVDEEGKPRFFFTPEADVVLRAAQAAQDAGKDWGSAYGAARDAYVSWKMSNLTSHELDEMNKVA